MEIEPLQDRLVEINDECQQIRAKAAGEKRDLSVEEESALQNLLDEFDRVEERIGQLTKLKDQTDRLKQGVGRKSQPEAPAATDGDGHGNATLSRPAKDAKGNHRLPAVPVSRAEKNGGFHSLGDFGFAVARACSQGGAMDPRLERLASATTWANESSGSDGGFAVPPDFRTEVMEQVLGEDSLLNRCDLITVTGNSFSCPTDATTPWQSSGGIQAYWDGEAAAATQSKPALGETTVKLNKVRALVPVTEELLQDASAMNSYLRRKAPAKIAFKVSLAILQGTGVGQPTGIIHAPGTVSVAKETSQTADTLIAANVIKMYSRMYGPSRSRAVWLINQDIEPMLMTMSVPGKDGVGNNVTGYGGLVYMPANGLAGAPYGTLFGRPVIPTQACETLGDKGDIVFADMQQYLALLKSGTNPRVDTSMHLWFDQDLIAFKFVLRVGGQPWFSAPITARDGGTTYSSFVTLDERS